MFIFYDGDNIGEKFAEVYRSNDLAKLKLLSVSIADIHAEIKSRVEDIGARLLEFGGDEGLIESELNSDKICQIVLKVWQSFGFGVTTGIGKTPSAAFKLVQKLKG